jgi:hypothetical protein
LRAPIKPKTILSAAEVPVVAAKAEETTGGITPENPVAAITLEESVKNCLLVLAIVNYLI